MKEKTTVEIDAKNPKIILVNGKKFIEKKTTSKKIGKITHADKIIFSQFDEEQFDRDLDFIVKKIKKSVSVEEILKDLLKESSPKTLKEIVEKLKLGAKPKKQKGCIGFEIGGKYLEITP